MDWIEDRLTKIELRQDATVQAVNKVLDALETQTELLRELLEWANRPPSSNLDETLKHLATAIEVMGEYVLALPDQIAEAVAEKLR